MIAGVRRAAASSRTRFALPGRVLFVSLLIAGCAGAPRYPEWVPGTYSFQAMHADAGVVEGTIEVAERGPVQVSTASLGACLPPEPLRLADRGRWFECASDYRVYVELGRRGEDPVVGQVSNERSEILTKQVPSGCARYAESPTGRDVCVLQSFVTVEERVTTGSSRTFRVVSSDVPK